MAAGHVFDVPVRFTAAGIVAALVVLAVGGAVMAAVYAGMLRVLRVSEISHLVELLRTRFSRA